MADKDIPTRLRTIACTVSNYISLLYCMCVCRLGEDGRYAFPMFTECDTSLRHVGAAAPTTPKALIDQLKAPGRYEDRVIWREGREEHCLIPEARM